MSAPEQCEEQDDGERDADKPEQRAFTEGHGSLRGRSRQFNCCAWQRFLKGTPPIDKRSLTMDSRKERTEEARALQERDAPQAWDDYRAAQVRRLENMVKLRAERLRQGDKQKAGA
jgi:hypothetical protein